MLCDEMYITSSYRQQIQANLKMSSHQKEQKVQSEPPQAPKFQAQLKSILDGFHEEIHKIQFK